MSTTDLALARNVVKYQHALATDDRRAQDRLFVLIWGAVRHPLMRSTHARSYVSPQTPWDDIEQVVRLGVFEALKRYDPARGPFLALATRVVACKIYSHANEGRSVVHEHCHVCDNRRLYRAAHAALEATLGRPPTDDEIVASSPSESRAKRLRSAILHPTPPQVDSLDFDDDDEWRLHPTADAADDATDRIAASDALTAWTAPDGPLTELERKVLCAVAQTPDSHGTLGLGEAAKALGVSLKSVDNAVTRVRKKFRSEADSQGLTPDSSNDDYLALRFPDPPAD